MTRLLLAELYTGKVVSVSKCLQSGADINAFDDTTGLSALHIAIGRNHLELVQFLLDRGASVAPDRHGRWPSTIAELCEVDGQICDLIADAEGRTKGV